jgi:DNA modification methylase
MVMKNTKSDLLGKDKDFAKKDTSYSSFWLFNKERDINSVHFKDSFVNFYDETKLLSEFNPTIAKNIISFWSEKDDIILDPFSGRSRALISYAMNRKYYGYEISSDAYNYMLDEFEELGLFENEWFTNNIKVYNKDCMYLLEDLEDDSVDLVFTCPPYWDLEKYESSPGQLSDYVDYSVFLDELMNRLIAASQKLKPGKYLVIVLGDFRKRGKYISFHSDLLQKMGKMQDLILHDVIVAQNIPFNTSAFYFGAIKHKKFTSKAHEYILVWKKKD